MARVLPRTRGAKRGAEALAAPTPVLERSAAAIDIDTELGVVRDSQRIKVLPLSFTTGPGEHSGTTAVPFRDGLVFTCSYILLLRFL